ncbi:biopolymer transporter ExbD [Nostoc linckia z18]|uniref:Biopolymer transporter ExbD n=2 Tax=Nostoc linckia TaxID=92942 RepID=A0A9Q5ZCX3_NOSLI|nr:biopolymer transporter ExbD [Nostoc linckia]PHK38903.1 biopolymer transporter ExbD [Nostoc linckia z16]PHJ64610.1 biopolymer transporter ExbD [Nostoc linckia z1]PHJ69961.1 biopolymer transporter ExbD [Nostoc linckia z3]PHJ73036.1 biopolymer transporter ExbD [Nostoc linckia z2]PHJ80673.1 biopolymer transporter ExbD [Nostoc linckia z4]
MKVNLHTPIEEVQIQIIPLIDVVFCILTFFLLAALQFTRQQAINVDLPKASTKSVSAIASQSGNQIVTIDAVGNTYIEKQPVKRDDLAQRLKLYLQANPNGVIVLNASRTATYNDVIETLDLLRQVGGDRVSLGIIPGPSQPPTNPLNQSPVPSFPVNPGEAPVPGINPEGNLTPRFPSVPGQNISPINPDISNPAVPVAPGSQSTPKR